MSRSALANPNVLQPRANHCACGGSCPRCQATSNLEIGEPDDPYEREADAVTERVMVMADPQVTPALAATGLRRKCATSAKEDDEEIRVQPKAESSSDSASGDVATAPSLVHDVLSSPGQPLPTDTRAFFEPRFGQDFGAVRVHDDARAAQSATAIDALAYTSGSHIVFGAGQHSAQSDRGRRLLAHELAHVRQGERGVHCFSDPDQSSLMGLGSLAEVADALLDRASVDQYPMLAELVAAREHYSSSGTLQVPASALAELAQIAAQAAALLPAWVPAPQIALPEPGLAMAQVAVNPWTIVIIILVLIVLALIFAIWWLWPWLRRWLGFGTEPVEEPETGTEPGTGDTGEAPATGDTGGPLSCGEDVGEAPQANPCGIGACAGVEDFCRPYRSEAYATCLRDGFKDNALDAVGGFVDDRVKPVWALYLSGGQGAPKNYSGEFAGDFADAETTLQAVDFLQRALEDDLVNEPPTATLLTESEIDARIGDALDQLGNPRSGDRMNFFDKKTIPGNLAGDVGTEQGACAAGANPSTAPDERNAAIHADIERIDPSVVEVQASIMFNVRDTVDLCPGGCGEDVEQLATRPFSRYEATGISGDVPFVVNYRVVPDPFELDLPEGELEDEGIPGSEDVEEETDAMP